MKCAFMEYYPDTELMLICTKPLARRNVSYTFPHYKRVNHTRNRYGLNLLVQNGPILGNGMTNMASIYVLLLKISCNKYVKQADDDI